MCKINVHGLHRYIHRYCIGTQYDDIDCSLFGAVTVYGKQICEMFIYDCYRFNESLDVIRNRHSTVVETMANGVLELKEELKSSGLATDDRIPSHIDNCIQYFLDRFYMSRIGIRMIIHQHCK